MSITNNTRSTVDLLLTNVANTELEVNRTQKLTDHDMINFKKNLKVIFKMKIILVI